MRIKTNALAMIVSLLTAGTIAVAVSCSSSSSSTATTGGDAATGGDAGPVTSCPTSTLQVVFAPMYSAYESSHTYQIPAVVTGVASSAITWSSSDSSMVDLARDSSTGGVMITVQKAGTVQIIASAGGLCGSSTLTITAATPDEWTSGNSRYNDGVVLTGVGLGGDGGTTQAACTNCHGATASGAFKTVSHTPEQTGGFSDDDLKGIFRNGTVPDGGYFDPSIVPYQAWQSFHKWDMTDDQAKGIVVYLRALTPEAQKGSSNFGGRVDGGIGPGGGGPNDAGTD